MTQLLVLREHLRNYYQKYSHIINPLFRLLIGTLTFFSANEIIGYNPFLNHWYIVVILSIFSIVIPSSALVLMAAVFVVAHIFYVSPFLSLVIGVIFAILYFSYAQFVPKHAYLFLAFFVGFPLHIVYAIPIFLGLIMGPVAVVPIVFGVGIYYLLQTVVSVVSTSTDTSINLYHVVLQQFVDNQEMYAVMLVFCIVMIVVNIIRSREMDYAFEIAIIAGGVINVILLLVINYFLSINIEMLALLLGTVFSLLIVWVMQFMHLALNYSGVENLQFEDDEYYYYVRAVPKMSVAAPNKRVKRFNANVEVTEEVDGAEEDIVFPEEHEEQDR